MSGTKPGFVEPTGMFRGLAPAPGAGLLSRLTSAASDGAGTPRTDEAKMKVLELMAETLHSNGLEAAPRTSPTISLGLPRRISTQPFHGLAARTAGNAMRTGPTPAAASVTVNRIIAAVNTRIVGLLLQAEAVVDQLDTAKVELSLLVRLYRSLRNHVGRVATDVVLADSIVEFADTVPNILADLEAGGARRLRRLLDYNSELMAELGALGGGVCTAELKPQLKQAIAATRAFAEQPAALRLEKTLQPVAQSAFGIYKRLSEELESRCPRQHGGLLDELIKL